LTPQEARDLYEACLLDTLDVCISVENAHVWICYNQDGDREQLCSLITRLKRANRIAGMFPDQGGKFDECMQYAADFLLRPGREDKLAESALIVGGDTIALQPSTLCEALEKLEILNASPAGQQAAVLTNRFRPNIGAAMVVSADQEGGFNLVGYTCNTPFDFGSVFYNMDGITALEGLAEKARQKRIPILPLAIAFDIDLPVDIASLIPVLNVLEQGAAFDSSLVVPERIIEYLREIGLQSTAEPVDGWS
jgi:hypothetical protein